ncbi:MAG: ABC transporter permease, partial [Longimicrobiales bacterium]
MSKRLVLLPPMLWRASRRYHLQHPWQLALSVLGIALGVAVVVGVDLSTASARAAFRLTTEAVTGGATHHVVGSGSGGVPDSVYRMLRVDRRIRALAPVVEGRARVGEGEAAHTFRLLGVDPFAEAPFRPYLTAQPEPTELPERSSAQSPESRARHHPSLTLGWRRGNSQPVSTLLTRPGAVLLSSRSARESGLEPGDSFTVLVDGHRRGAVLASFLDRTAADADVGALERLMVADIATAQEWLDRPGFLDRIDVRADDRAMTSLGGGGPGRGPRPGEESDGGVLDPIRDALPQGLRVVPASARAETAAAMSRAFEINLAALALLALVFGVFLVYNSMTFSVVQRRALIGLLRAQGVTRTQVFTIVTAEAAVIGVVATVIGLVLGVALSGGLVRLVARTINDLYFEVTVTRLLVTPLMLLKAAGLGIGATVLASLPPARESTSTPPRAALARSVLEARMRSMARPAAAAGAAVIAAGLSLLMLPSQSLALGFIAVFATIFGAALIAPAATMLLMRALRPAAGRAFGGLGRMATRGVVA